MTVLAANGQVLPAVPQRTQTIIRAFADHFLGYGALDAKYWFIGTEPGMDTAEDVLNWVSTWDRMGQPRTVCNRRAHLESGYTQWHRRNPKLQQTWRPLMLTLCSYLGEYQTNEECVSWMKRYQETSLGCAGGESALLELGALNAPNRSATWPYSSLSDPAINTRAAYVDNFLGHRAAVLRDLAVCNQPQFVWMYGARAEYRGYWNTIAKGTDWQTDRNLSGVEYRLSGGIVYVVTDHVTYHRTNHHWIALGLLLRRLVETQVGSDGVAPMTMIRALD